MDCNREKVICLLNSARHQELELCKTRFLAPVIKLGETKTYAPWFESHCLAVTIKAQDIVNSSGRSFKPLFGQIKSAGGIHSYLNFQGNIILSSIMKDKTIRNFTPEMYADLIRTLKPNYYITPDGETYFGEKNLSAYEIKRMIEETYFLLGACTKSKAIGLVKGCNMMQIEWHADKLKSMGISTLAFHAGDFICQGNNRSIHQAAHFAARIRKKASMLIVYGLGASINLGRFSFADGFITQSHFIDAFYGMKILGPRLVPFKEAPTRDIIMQNLRAIEENILKIETQPRLTQWADNNSATHWIIPEKCFSGIISERQSAILAH